MEPAQSRHQIVRARISGIGIFLPEIGQITVAKNIQPVVYGNHYHLSKPAHILALIGDMLNS